MSIIGDMYEDEIIPPLTKLINEQKELLEECLDVLNFIPNQKVAGQNTYDLAAKIEKVLKQK